jgi:DNA replication protein DnaC
MDEQFAQTLKHLGLRGVLSHWDEYVLLAEQQDYSPVRWLRHVLEEESRLHDENSRRLRLLRAKIPDPWRMETFPFERQPNLDKKRLLSLYDAFEYMEKHHNFCFIGPTGSGKTSLATGFLIQAIERGYNGRFVLFPELIDELFRSIADHSEAEVLARYYAYDPLHIDEIGYVETEPAQVGLFFTLMHKRHQRKCSLITSNLGFAEWGSFLKNPHLTAALIDRLTQNSYVFNMSKCHTLRPPLQGKGEA